MPHCFYVVEPKGSKMRKLTEKLAVLGGVLALLAAQTAVPQALGPDVLVRQMSDEVLAAIKQDRAIRAGDSNRIAALVETRIAPHFDFRRVTEIATGANWRRAQSA